MLRFLKDAAYRRRIGQELNKGERSHALSRSLFFRKEGAVRGRTFQDQVNTFSCLAVLHNAVVAWNTLRLGEVVAGLRADERDTPDELGQLVLALQPTPDFRGRHDEAA